MICHYGIKANASRHCASNQCSNSYDNDSHYNNNYFGGDRHHDHQDTQESQYFPVDPLFDTTIDRDLTDT